MKQRERWQQSSESLGGEPDVEAELISPDWHSNEPHSTPRKLKRPRRRSHQRSWAAAFGTGGLTTACVLLTYHVLRAVVLSQRAATFVEEESRRDTIYRKTLTFEVCNGMANQRLSLLYGIMLAYELGRTVVLPQLLLSGVQWTEEDALADKNNLVPMSRIYDVPYFITSLSMVGIDVMTPDEAPPEELLTKADISKMEDPVEGLNSQHHQSIHLAVGCPLFKLGGPYFTGTNNRVMWAVLNGLRPGPQLGRLVDGVVTKLSMHPPTNAYNFLHLRMELDWVIHCERWERIPDGVIRNNCMNNTDDVHRMLYALNVPTSEPLYVASFWEQCDTHKADKILGLLESSGYHVYTSKDFKSELSGEDREVNAMVDYEVALRAKRFIGNSVSTFSALAIHQRRHNGGWATHYNGGNVPIAEFLPMELLPWVFVYSDGRRDWDPLIKAAVRSATEFGTIHAFCIWLGDRTDAPMYKWLRRNGVTMIHHQPAWEEQLWAMAQPHMEENSKQSPVYANRDALLSDFIRMDLPLLPELEQHIHVLFTDPDVFFAQKVTLSSFPLPLPETIGMVSDQLTPGGLDPGVMLYNMPTAREDYDDFKLFVMNNRHGGRWPGYVLGIAGAYEQFYEHSTPHMHISKEFAAKPWQEVSPQAKIVHFSGPKPQDYVTYYLTQGRSSKEQTPCSTLLGNKCELGFRLGLCPYARKWNKLLNDTEDDVGLMLWYACTALYAPYLQGIGSNFWSLNASMPRIPAPSQEQFPAVTR